MMMMMIVITVMMMMMMMKSLHDRLSKFSKGEIECVVAGSGHRVDVYV